MSDDLKNQALAIAARRIAEKRMAANANPVSSFNTGANKALIDVVGFPVDVANAGLNLVGLGSERPVGGSKHLTGLAERAVPGYAAAGTDRDLNEQGGWLARRFRGSVL